MDERQNIRSDGRENGSEEHGGKMRATLVLIGAVTVLSVGGCASEKQTGQVYKHPSINIEFTASPGWEQVPRPEEPGVYEAVDPQSAVHVVLWQTETEQTALGYLLKMAGMKGLALDNQPKERSISTHDAWVLDTTGSEGEVAVHTLLAVIPHARVSSRPKERVLFIAQVWCQEGRWTQHMRSMRNILASVEIVE
jgi:hypothetical protein